MGFGKKIVLITGCNSPDGIGFATAKELAEHGYCVYATIRDEGKSQELKTLLSGNREIFIKFLDITSESMITSLVSEVVVEQGKIDVLINNAGYGLVGAIEQVTIEQVKREYDVNVFGTTRLIQEVLPYMRENKSGRIINVSSMFCVTLALPFLGFYIGTKAALEKIAESLAFEVAPWNIYVTNFQPGPVKTKLSKEWGSRLNGKYNPYRDYGSTAQKWVNEKILYESPDDSAKVIRRIIEQPRPKINEQSTEKVRQYVNDHLGNKTKELENMLEFVDY